MDVTNRMTRHFEAIEDQRQTQHVRHTDPQGEPWEPVPFEIHHRGDCPLDCPWCNGGGEG